MNENYIPLYRKYRPQSLEQVVGQTHIKQALTNAINMDRISHAYLFTGPRGTGKTSTARIFAKSLNCVKGPTITPCNECENCKNITNSIPIDVIEIDAASNRSVNDAEEIIQNVSLSPIQSKYKIYIIDEVHMLTPQAFNALLKTLEEPPKNVIFILATTEIHKVLDTIKSRCQRFDFKRITTDDIVNHLKYVSTSESIDITDDALTYIAQNSAGGMRDSLALLDQLSVLSSNDKTIDVDDLNSLLGRLSFKSLLDLFSSVVSSNQTNALMIVNDIYSMGNEPVQILSNLLEFLRNILIIKSAGNTANNIVQVSKEQLEEMSKIIDNIELHQILALIDSCSNYIKELKLTSNPKLWLDIAVLDMANLTQNTKLAQLQERLSLLESGTVQSVKPQIQTQSIIQPIPKPSTISQPQPSMVTIKKIESKTNIVEVVDSEPKIDVPMSKTSNVSELKNLWGKLLDNISSVPLRAILKQQALPVKITTDEVIIAVKSPTWLDKIQQDKSKFANIQTAAKTLLGSEVSNLIIRAPQQNDEQLRKNNSITNIENSNVNSDLQEEKKNLISKVKQEDNIGNEMFDISETKTTDSEKDFHVKDSVHSDNVNMILQLFEGKFIE